MHWWFPRPEVTSISSNAFRLPKKHWTTVSPFFDSTCYWFCWFVTIFSCIDTAHLLLLNVNGFSYSQLLFIHVILCHGYEKKLNLGHPHETLCVTSVTLVVNWHHHVSLRQTGNVNGNKCACASISNPKIILLLSMLNMLLWEIIRTLLQCRLPRHLLTSCNAN